MLVAHRPSYLPATITARQQIMPRRGSRSRGMGARGVRRTRWSCANGHAPLAGAGSRDGAYWQQRKRARRAGRAEGRALRLPSRCAIFDSAAARLLQRWSYDLLSEKSAGRGRYNHDYEKPLKQSRRDGATIARFHRTLVRQQRSVHHPLNARLYIEQLLFSYTALLRGEDLTASYAR